ncbi:hypothetical protein DY000_02046052 [Brassica cretica]|uniref:Uncharacterized protein n=1 Tax=Brassica cretica TaxID=69181 RepID=A0ABQ7EUS5_BRACR|nr:hypothetical protein DY000_02046052 [Brassica cretica]
MSLYQSTRATSPERRREVAVTHIPERPGQSDMERSLAFLSRDTPLRATCQSDAPTLRGRSHFHGETKKNEARSNLSERPTKVAPEGRSDLSERHAEVAPRLFACQTHVFLRAFWSFHYARFTLPKPKF